MLGQYLRQFGQKLVRRKPQFREEPESSETPPPNTLDLVVIGLDNMLGAGIYILIGGSGQIRSWTSNHPFLTGGRPDYSVVWAVLCRVGNRSKSTCFWVLCQLCHNGTTVRLHHWLEPLTVFNYW